MSGKVAVRSLPSALTYTPMRTLRIHYRGGLLRLQLKLELNNPTGSIKYRTAVSLLASLDRQRPLVPGSRVVESTSGNLGVAMANLLRMRGCDFVAVIDPKVPPAIEGRLRAEGAATTMVRERDAHGGYLLTRLAKIAELMRNDPKLRWPDQYNNAANPFVHSVTTAVEIVEQSAGKVDAVLVAVSTGGTLAGISDGLQVSVPGVRIIAVDVRGSLVTSDVSHPHLLSGIGATRPSTFLKPWHYNDVARVFDLTAFAYCRLLLQDTGLSLGGSSGAILAAAVLEMSETIRVANYPVAVMPDGCLDYEETCYQDAWLAELGVLDEVLAVVTSARENGLSFELE